MPSAEPNDVRTRVKRDQSATIVHGRERFDAAAANAQKRDTLRLTRLRRRARERGFRLRHSDYGYALIDGTRVRVDGRGDLTLDEVEAHLQGAHGA